MGPGSRPRCRRRRCKKTDSHTQSHTLSTSAAFKPWDLFFLSDWPSTASVAGYPKQNARGRSPPLLSNMSFSLGERKFSTGEASGEAAASFSTIRVGVCTMNKKSRSKPMVAILTRLNARGTGLCSITRLAVQARNRDADALAEAVGDDSARWSMLADRLGRLLRAGGDLDTAAWVDARALEGQAPSGG